MTETGDGTAQATLDKEFLRSFSVRWHAAWNSHDHHQVAAELGPLAVSGLVRRWRAHPPRAPRGHSGIISGRPA
jgi:hypothetical protein